MALTQEQIDDYRSQGYLFPFRCISREETRQMRTSLDAFKLAEGLSVGDIHLKGHLCFKWSYDLAHRPALLDPVEDLIGPNILVFASKFWIKEGHDGTFVSWHQDSAYFGLEPHDLVTAWIALTDSHRTNGCMRVIPESHIGPAYQHVETYHEKNLLARGQAIDGLDEDLAVDMELEAGQFSLHHERMVHGSLANQTDDVRIGLSLFYVPTHVRSTIGRRTACLVRGIDTYGHWDPDPVPHVDRDPKILEHMRAAHRRYHDHSVPQEAAPQSDGAS